MQGSRGHGVLQYSELWPHEAGGRWPVAGGGWQVGGVHVCSSMYHLPRTAAHIRSCIPACWPSRESHAVPTARTCCCRTRPPANDGATAPWWQRHRRRHRCRAVAGPPAVRSPQQHAGAPRRRSTVPGTGVCSWRQPSRHATFAHTRGADALHYMHQVMDSNGNHDNHCSVGDRLAGGVHTHVYPFPRHDICRCC